MACLINELPNWDDHFKLNRLHSISLTDRLLVTITPSYVVCVTRVPLKVKEMVSDRALLSVLGTNTIVTYNLVITFTFLRSVNLVRRPMISPGRSGS